MGSGRTTRATTGTASGARLPRDLHPVAWWCWALGVAAAASATTNPLVLLLLGGAVCLVVVARRSDRPHALAFRVYVLLALLVVVLRVLFRVLLGGSLVGAGEQVVLLDLPRIPLPDVVLGIELLGPVTREDVLSGAYDGLRLAAVIVCVGAANALADPKRLLRAAPAALHEVATAVVVAVALLPQLGDSVRRVRAAQDLRGGPPGRQGRVARLRRVLVPVLEDALERALQLAASMDLRGYGRAPGLTPAERRRTGALMVLGLLGCVVGTYAVLDRTAPRVLAAPLLAASVAVALLGLVSAGRRVRRSRYRPDPWRWPETVVVLAGAACAVVLRAVSTDDPAAAYPALDAVPPVAPLVLLAVALAALPARAAPPPRLARPARPSRAVADPAAPPLAAPTPALPEAR